MSRALKTPIRPDHTYVEWAGNGRCFFCNRVYEDHERKSASLLYGPVAAWQVHPDNSRPVGAAQGTDPG
jgi:hypothetical protein